MSAGQAPTQFAFCTLWVWAVPPICGSKFSKAELQKWMSDLEWTADRHCSDERNIRNVAY
jgi:hypothetical protein